MLLSAVELNCQSMYPRTEYEVQYFASPPDSRQQLRTHKREVSDLSILSTSIETFRRTTW